jgi:uncharacterized membrane protein (DUF4010 family)
MAVLFHLVWLLITYAESALGSVGLTATAIVTGLTDVDALTASLTLRAREGLSPAVAAAAIATGIAANTTLKLLIALMIGSSTFRRRVSITLAALAMATLASLLVFPL